MPLPIIYFVAAGALAGAGSGGALYMWQRGQQEAALRQALRDAEAADELVRRQIAHEKLRQAARELGIDPEIPVRGYEALRDRQVSPEDVIAWIKAQLRQPPGRNPNPPQIDPGY